MWHNNVERALKRPENRDFSCVSAPALLYLIAARARELYKERGGKMVELDQFKYTLNGYQGPLVELRDSL